MADAALQVMRFHIDPYTGAKIKCRDRLADGANVVALTFHRQQRGSPDRRRRNRSPFEGQFA
jgi:hypothetical protein